LHDMQGSVTEATLRYLIRDHDAKSFEARKALFLALASEINRRYGEGTAVATVTDSYYNMKEKIEPHMRLIDKAIAAFEKNGIPARTVPIRGGTDGARLSWEGLPCPNLPTGGYNYHSVREWIPAKSLDQITDVLVDLVVSFAE
ncbi:MAG: peptidase T, partial [Clostridiales bacterium]|nr:peptidase T [Clostridiales bacterium]